MNRGNYKSKRGINWEWKGQVLEVLSIILSRHKIRSLLFAKTDLFIISLSYTLTGYSNWNWWIVSPPVCLPRLIVYTSYQR